MCKELVSRWESVLGRRGEAAETTPVELGFPLVPLDVCSALVLFLSWLCL